MARSFQAGVEPVNLKTNARSSWLGLYRNLRQVDLVTFCVMGNHFCPSLHPPADSAPVAAGFKMDNEETFGASNFHAEGTLAAMFKASR